MAAQTGTQAVDRAAQLLVRVLEAGEPLSFGALTEGADLPKSTSSRLLNALECTGWSTATATAHSGPGRS